MYRDDRLDTIKRIALIASFIILAVFVQANIIDKDAGVLIAISAFLVL